jgi:epothilone synthetase B
MDSGWEQVAAVLGIHLAGAAYLPIDPQLPRERQHYLLAQGEVRLVLTQSWLEEKLSWPPGLERLRVDTQVGDAELAALEGVQQPTDLAYVIYTSGSTGFPKGVLIDHRGAVNTVLDINRRFSVTAHDRVLALSALNFDLSVYDLFGLLAAGGAIVMPEADLRTDPAHWLELMVRHGVTLWNTVPALMQMLVDYHGDEGAAAHRVTSALRLVMLSGDWIPVTLPDRIKRWWQGVEVYSLGGATEASIWSICYPIETVDPAWSSIPYGQPLSNQTVHVFDEHLQPRPVWVPGELYIGGTGVALGYWRDTERSRARFLVHPETGERLYRTGDLGRYRRDGQIEFLGREDFQIKLRGHRIELGEIESHLLQHPGVKETVVQAIAHPKGGKRLVAYVVLDAVNDDSPLTMDETHQAEGNVLELLAEQAPSIANRVVPQRLSDYLSKKVPDYMIPADYV